MVAVSVQPTEHELQKSIVVYLTHALPKDAVFFAVPNGGDRNPIVASKLKAEGVKPGVPDLLILWRGQTFGLEVKTLKGRVSVAQELFHEKARRAGMFVEVVRSLSDVSRYLEARGVPLGARVNG